MSYREYPLTSYLMECIEKFHTKTGMKFTTIGMKSIGNARMWERLQNGGTITLEKADEVFDWLENQGFKFNRLGE